LQQIYSGAEEPVPGTGGIRQKLEIWEQRIQWWSRMPSIIKNSSKLVVLESYFGNHHAFWDSLEERLSDTKPFEFVLLTLGENSAALKNCLEVTGRSAEIAQNDKISIQKLKRLQEESPHREKKKVEFLHWNGHGPGSIVWWIADDKEYVGLGCWLQCSRNTDKTPWIVLRQGLLFKYLKIHCENTIKLARSSPA
jgi:hypothetical protein